jgi:hypothetical protein
MKKMKKILFTFMLLMMTNVAFAETKSDGTSEVPKDVVEELPGAGPDVVINVPYFVRHKLPPPGAGNLALRGGLSVGTGFPARTDPSYTGGLVGQIGYVDSMWRLEATFRAGSCKKGWGDVALDSGLALMGSISKNFRAGIGADLLFCSDISDHPKEMATERIIGGSLRLQVEEGHLSLSVLAGVGRADHQIPGGREKEVVLYQTLAVSYLF